MAEAESVFARLPVEVKRQIFAFLSLEDRIKARGVCTVWCDLVDECLAFSVQLQNDTLDLVQVMNRPIRSLVVSCLTKSISFMNDIRGNIGTQVDHLHLGQVNKPATSHWISQDNVVALLTCLKEIRTLSIVTRSLRIKDMSLFALIHLENVTTFHVVARRLSELEIFHGILEMELPCLQNLVIDWEKVYINTVEKMLPLYEDIYDFVTSHKTTLVTLHVIMPYHWIDRRHHHALPPPLIAGGRETKRDSLLENLPQVQLTELHLEGLPVEGSPTFSLGFHLINSQNSLEKLNVQDLKVGYYSHMEPLFRNSALTLRSVTIQGSSMGANSYGPLTCTLFKPCVNLVELIINNPQITELLQIEDLPLSLESLSLKMPVNGGVVYPWIWSNLTNLKELAIRPTIWDPNAVVDLYHFQNLLALPSLTKLTLSDGLFQTREILEFTQSKPGLTLQAASYSWPDLVNVHIHIDRSVFVLT